MKRGLVALLLATGALVVAAHADEMSGDDKLRMLYSHRFAFTRDGFPLFTVELMHGQKSVSLSAPGGLRVLPEGEGGPEMWLGDAWKVTVEDARPAKIRWWTIVSRRATDPEVALWKGRGYAAKTFETGAVFGVEGDVIDSRELFLGVAPEWSEEAARRSSAALADKWKVDVFVHPEMLTPPQGTVVARAAQGDGAGQVRNPGVLWFSPAATGKDGEDATITIEDVVHGGGGSQLGAEKKTTRRYRGQAYVTLGWDGTLTVVNAVPEDRLLAGLVPSEIFAEAPAEALKAQSVAAHDELLAKIGTRHFAQPFLVCSTQHCQVYGGVEPEDPRTTRAVKATRGEVLFRDSGGLVPAYYSASCGGFGEHNESIWGTPADPALRGHLDASGADGRPLAPFQSGITEASLRAFLDAPAAAAHCGRTKYAKGRFRWTVERPAAELDALVAAEYPALGSIREITPLERGISGRIKKLELVGARTSVVVEGELRIRRLLGGLKSSLFVVRAAKGAWIFEGAGFGHGVGMCQTGAIGMAEAGFDYKTILEHYYRGSHLRKLY